MLYVEGGGTSNVLKTACRKGFRKFLEEAGLKGQMPRVVACGSRRNAYDSFCTAIANGESACLLVDSEAPISAQHQQGAPVTWMPWEHLLKREGDNWSSPSNANADQCHLMVQCMEAWFLADRATLNRFFGHGFRDNALPAEGNNIETLSKEQIYTALSSATRGCKTKSEYGKGEHSFKILAMIDPNKVVEASPWAKRFVEGIREIMTTS